MTMSFENKYTKLAFISGTVLLLDQISKAVILKTMPLYNSIAVFPGFFSITHIHNPGGAFGFLAGQSPDVRKMVFLVVSFFAMCLILYLYHTAPRSQPALSTGFAMIFGGAAGNLTDRIRFGSVVDFLDLYIGSYHWPAFNIADSSISIGMGIFVFHLLFRKMPG
jgi:signal peptidase II